MLRRIVLALTFVAVLGVGGLAVTSTAQAWHHHCHDNYGYGGYGGYYGNYGGYYPYVIRSSYYPSVYYGGSGYYPRRHHGHYHGHHHHDDGIHFSIGF